MDVVKQKAEFMVETSARTMTALVSGYAAAGRTIRKDEVVDEAHALSAALHEKLSREGWIAR